jgi:hypothetical protein
MTQVRWVHANDNAFGVDILDCRPTACSLLAVTRDQEIATKFVSLRQSNGDSLRTTDPKNAVSVASNLEYAYNGKLENGPICKAAEMEYKWDVHLYDDVLYFSRSWTGDLEYRLKIVFDSTCFRVVSIAGPGEIMREDPTYAIAVVDFLIRSHVYHEPIPHPYPRAMEGSNESSLSLFSFSQYGRHGLYGTFADTTQLRAPVAEQQTGA